MRPGITLHGMRSAFRDWTADVAHATPEIAEGCLAHVTGNAVQAAYKRTDELARRRALMEAWATYLANPQGGAEVLPFKPQSQSAA